MPEWIVKYWTEWVFGLLIAILTAAYKWLSMRLKKERDERLAKAKKDEEEMLALKNGMRSMLRRWIIFDCESAQREKACSVVNKESIQDMYECYHALGGNGIVKGMVDSTLALPTQKLTNMEEKS